MRYITFDDFMEKVKNDPFLLEHTQDPEELQKIKEAGPLTSANARRRIIESLRRKALIAGGAAMIGSREAYILSRDDLKPIYNRLEHGDQEMRKKGIDIFRAIGAHELGHILGLEEFERTPETAGNPMAIPFTQETIANPTFSEGQVKKILAYFKEQ